MRRMRRPLELPSRLWLRLYSILHPILHPTLHPTLRFVAGIGFLVAAGPATAALLMSAPSIAIAQSLPAAPSDTVVRLGYAPGSISGGSFAVLLEESVMRVESDGTWRREMRQVIQVLDANGIKSVAERSISYIRGQQNLAIRWARVLRLNGEVISDKPALEQDADVPAAVNNPVYQDQRVRRFSLAGVAVNSIVDVAYTIETTGSLRKGDFFATSRLNGALPVRRASFTLDVPEGYSPHIVEYNLVSRRAEEIVGGRHKFVWTARDQVPVNGEPFASDSNGIVQSVAVSAEGDWNGMASWYNNLARDRYTVTPAVAKVADSVIAAGAPKSRADSLRAWHKWITQDIRYVSVSLGIGGYQPRSPDEVLRTGFGDCKDKATLFIAVLRRSGIKAEPVILSLNGKPNSALPSIYQFDHAIAAVPQGNGWTYVDLTADIYPYGELPEAYQGSFAVQVTPEGKAREIRLPVSSVESNTMALRWSATLDSAGVLRGSVREAATGSLAPALRALLVSSANQSRRAGIIQGLARRFMSADAGTSATADSLHGTDGRNMSVSPVQEYEVVVEGALKTIGNARVLRVPAVFRSAAALSRGLLARVDSTRPRLMPIDAARIVGPAIITQEWSVILPAGFTVDLPHSVNTTTFFGSYRSTWTLAGQELKLVREMVGARGVYGPERLPEVLVWAKSVIADDIEFLTLKAGSKQQ